MAGPPAALRFFLAMQHGADYLPRQVALPCKGLTRVRPFSYVVSADPPH